MSVESRARQKPKRLSGGWELSTTKRNGHWRGQLIAWEGSTKYQHKCQHKHTNRDAALECAREAALANPRVTG